MSTAGRQNAQAPVLPELEALLLRAARRRAAPRRVRRRWMLALAAAALLLAATAAAAATGIFRVADGSTSEGTFTVETRPVPAHGAGEPPAGAVCLQLTYDGRHPSFGCGARPSAKKPFGLVVFDRLGESSREGVVYGLVTGNVARVSVLGPGGAHYDAATEEKEGVPGRFFATVVPQLERIEVVGYDSGGRETARIGSLAQPAHPPLSHSEAVEDGDPAGFAPTIAP